MSDNHDPLQPHAHEPNPEPPSADPSFELVTPDGRTQTITVSDLEKLPETAVPNCYIVSTGHGTTGPFTFSGVTLQEFVAAYVNDGWSQVEVISADGFGNRVFAEELAQPNAAGPIILAYKVDGRPLTRQEGVVRMIVPSERDDALRQVKWVGKVRIRP
jgi:DMSO/TMAO reductase YedYZ molybdopterin-dependent catalytic subunit